jgi:hypothetical protein
MQQADRIAGGGVAEAGCKLLRDGGTADHRAPLEQGDRQACASQIGRGHESVVACPHDGDVQRWLA